MNFGTVLNVMFTASVIVNNLSSFIKQHIFLLENVEFCSHKARFAETIDFVLPFEEKRF